MMPVLYEAGAIKRSDFTTLGLGTLPDAASCTVTEERNGEFVLDMTYPVGGLRFSEIAPGRVIYAFPWFGASTPQPFEITAVSRPMMGRVQITAIHAAQVRLAYIVANPTYTRQASAQTVMDFIKGISAGYSAATFPISMTATVPYISTERKFLIEEPTRVKDLLYGKQGSILDVWGGEFAWNHDSVTLHEARGLDRHMSIVYGKNLADIVQDVCLDGVATTVYAYWRSDNAFVYSGASRLQDSMHVGDFAYRRIIPVDVTEQLGTDTTPTADQVASAGQTYINANAVGVPDVTCTVKIAMRSNEPGQEWMKDLERINLCDTVNVFYPPMGVNLSAKVVGTVWDVLRERYESLEIGTRVTPTLAAAILKYAR